MELAFLLFQSASGLAALLIWVLVFLLVFAGIYYLVRTLLPPELQRFAIAVLVVLGIIVLIYFALSFTGGGGFRLR